MITRTQSDKEIKALIEEYESISRTHARDTDSSWRLSKHNIHDEVRCEFNACLLF
jgi:hypothetical protein